MAALARRLLCDAVALEGFAGTAMGLADEDALRPAAAAHGWGDSVLEAFVEVCGFERVFGSLATRRNQFSLPKAALLDLRRGAARHEVAGLTGLTAEKVAMAFQRLRQCRWVAERGIVGPVTCCVLSADSLPVVVCSLAFATLSHSPSAPSGPLLGFGHHAYQVCGS